MRSAEIGERRRVGAGVEVENGFVAHPRASCDVVLPVVLPEMGNRGIRRDSSARDGAEQPGVAVVRIVIEARGAEVHRRGEGRRGRFQGRLVERRKRRAGVARRIEGVRLRRGADIDGYLEEAACELVVEWLHRDSDVVLIARRVRVDESALVAAVVRNRE